MTGTVNVVGRTYCITSTPEILVKTRLYKRVCFIWCLYVPYGPTGSDSDTDSTFVQANSANDCVNNWYRGVSYHWMRGADGNTYDLRTSKIAYVDDCP